MSPTPDSLERQLYRRMRATCEAHTLLEPDDRVLVAVSGGKDSYTLLYLLRALATRLPFTVDLIAVHLDQRQPGYDGKPLADWLEAFGCPYEILSEDTYSVVIDKLDDRATYCSLCSRLRRGILYTAAERLGCNKIALGHHREDTQETFLLNLLYAGRLQAMPARYQTDDGRFTVIRPLVECPEELIRQFAVERAFPILPCNLCGSQPNLKRDQMTALLDTLEKDHPNVRNVIAAALGNISPSHLLDRDVARAWEERSADIQPAKTPRERQRHAAAEPVRTNVRRLRLV